MGKTLIIKGADFSAIKVGNVEVPRVYQQMTLDWITASGNSFTDAQKDALDDLVLALIANNRALWNKLDRIWLPMVAVDKAHSLYEYKNGVNSYESMDAHNQGVFDNSVGFAKNLGIYPAATSSTRAPLVDSSCTVNTKDCSMFILNAQYYQTPPSSQIKATIGTNNGASDSGGICVCFMQALPTDLMRIGFPTSAAGDYIQSANAEKTPSLRGIISNNDGRKALFSDGIKSIGAALDQSNTIATGIVLFNGGNPYMSYVDTTPKGAAIIGKAVTDNEALSLQEKVNALLSAMSA